MVEGDPGTRRYKWFRPRQAARGGIPSTTGSSAHFATGALYNSSSGPTVIVVRDWIADGQAAHSMAVGYVQGRLTGTNYPTQRLFPGDPAPAGLVDYSNQGSALALTEYAYGTDGATHIWPHDFPFAILPPGWSLVFQMNSAATSMSLAFLWEEVSIDELEYFYY